MKKVLFAIAIFMATLSTGGTYASASSVSMIKNPETNQASYWGANCTKTEMSGEVMTYTAKGEDVIKVIVKGGPAYVVYSSGTFTNLTAPINPNNDKPYGISHVIECGKVTTPTDPVKPVDPVKPTDPTKPSEPTKPTTPTTPVKPAVPTPPKQPVIVAESNNTSKESPVTTVPTPTELPNTGINPSAWLIVLMTAIVTFSYAARLAVIKHSIRTKL